MICTNPCLCTCTPPLAAFAHALAAFAHALAEQNSGERPNGLQRRKDRLSGPSRKSLTTPVLKPRVSVPGTISLSQTSFVEGGIFNPETRHFLSNFHLGAWMASAGGFAGARCAVVGRAGPGCPDAAELAGWVGDAFKGEPSSTLGLVIIFVWVSMLESPGSSSVTSGLLITTLPAPHLPSPRPRAHGPARAGAAAPVIPGALFPGIRSLATSGRKTGRPSSVWAGLQRSPGGWSGVAVFPSVFSFDPGVEVRPRVRPRYPMIQR